MVTWFRTIQTAVLVATALTPSASAWDRQTVAASREPATALTKGVIPGRYIVELEQGSTLGQRDVRRRAADVLGDLDTLGYDVDVKEDYSSISGRFEGVSIEVSNTDEGTLNQLKNISGVADAWPVFSITLDTDFDTNNPSPKWNPHAVTRVDELHKRGFKGKGQRVCIVDSGADSAHPVLAGRVAGGKNMLDDTTNIEDCNGHGTFVSSVVVGQNKDFSGVAPEAEVYMYKVFGCESSTSNDIVLKGLLAADADDCDIVSLSLGVDNGYSGSLMSQVASRIAQDRLVILAAGNAGEMGTFYASSPASGRGVIAVGSVNAKQVLGWPATIRSSGGDSLELRYITPDGQKLNESASVPLFFDEGDSCNPEQYGTEDQAVVVKRSVCPAGKAYNFLSSTGFGYYLIFDSYNQGVYYMSDIIESNPSVHLFALTEAHVGDWVEKEITAGRNLTLVIKADADAAASESDFAAGGQLSYFSSWGPTFENDFSPTIAAPGGAVYGAFPDNDYAIASGTSFSAPYIAGIAALFFAHGKKDASEFARRLSSTAALLPSYDASESKVVSDIASLAQQGAGLVDAVKVMDYQTVLISEPHISLNDTDNRVDTHKIRLRNTASAQVTYRISHVAASTVQGRDEYLYPYEYFPPLLSNVQGSIQGPESVTIAPGSSEEVEITIKAPPSSDGALWSGKVVFEGSNGEFIAVPYLGVEVSTYDWTALEGSPLAFRYDSDSGYLYPVDWQEKPYRPDESSSPEIYYALRYGTYEFSLDLVGENWSKDDFAYPLSAGAGSTQWYGPVRTQPDVFGGYTEFPIKYPLRFSNVGFNTFQSFSNGTKIPSGKYKILSRALRMFGNPSNPADWQLFLSDSFRIQLGDDPIPGVTSTTAESSTETDASTSTSLSAVTDVPTTTSTSILVTSTPVPGVTKTLRATASPTGIADTFVDVSLRRQGVDSPDIYDPNGWMELHVQILVPTRLKEGSTVTFALPPQFVDVVEDEYVTDPASNLVGSASFNNNTGLYTITFGEWAEWHSGIIGDFYLYCRLSQEFQAEIEAGTYYVEIPTVGKTFYPPIHYRAVDRSKVYEHQREGITDGDAVYYFDIEVPGQVGPWNSVTFVGSQAATDDGFLCDETTVSIGTEFDDGNQIVKSTDVTAASVQRCEVKTFRAVYSGEIPTDEVLKFSVANILGFKASWTLTLSYSLAIELTNGSTIGYDLRTLSFERYARSSPEAWFVGTIDKTGPVQGGTATSTSFPSSTIGFSSSISTPSGNATITHLSSTVPYTTTSGTTFLTSSMNSSTSLTATLSTPSTSSTTIHSSSSQDHSTPSTTVISSSSQGHFTSSATVISSSSQNHSAVSTILLSSFQGQSTLITSTVTLPLNSTTSTPSVTSFDTSVPGSVSSTTVLGEPSTTTNLLTKTTDSHQSTESYESTEALQPTQISSTGKVNSVSSLVHIETSQTSSDDVVVTGTRSVTVITSVCSETGWTKPVTVTIIVPCAFSDETKFTTVTSVCLRCAEHPVTVTYTEPAQTETGSSNGVIGTGSLTSHHVRPTSAQIPNQGPTVTIPYTKNQLRPETTASGNRHTSFTSVVLDKPTVSVEPGSQSGGNEYGKSDDVDTAEAFISKTTDVAVFSTNATGTHDLGGSSTKASSPVATSIPSVIVEASGTRTSFEGAMCMTLIVAVAVILVV